MVTRSDVFYAELPSDVIHRAVHAALGDHVHVRSWRELHGGLYNLTYLVTLDSHDCTRVVLRAGPPSAHELRSELRLLKSEVSVLPLLANLSVEVPRTIAFDGSRSVLDRDVVLQTVVEGVPAIPVVRELSGPARAAYYMQLGRITREVHAIEGTAFGAVLGPPRTRLAEALVDAFEAITADCRALALDEGDLPRVSAWVASHTDVFEGVVTPRLLAGDLWTPNVLLAHAEAAQPVITGVVDFDRAWWGDPAADWTIWMARRLNAPDRDAFWDGYGALPYTDEGAAARSLVYEARHLGAVLLERSRLGASPERIAETRDALGTISAALASLSFRGSWSVQGGSIGWIPSDAIGGT
ncbi:phosphotransferase [Microbacterium horticulturae]|uniref:Phosphotransferase n=1 Tax=Microbacterium horticulturae TaxID=3028316 RepID=A0ABY8BU57_9MICO|nr:phosphotransferase [Microbacterium sp. KACC 23027]WEG07706.1 phosphotransferase [Microbacterium sp. KACC 23027]